ncbi:AraC family transcriptional regulator [Paraburkholderia elongata]|uniref:Helix-turn-helix domain-containing protein n=1 Tax=Paraburkholderia elongata TaxID=2675747 RepID=A0A972NK12_9BURK|nr:AraC family transcriptional regulator [Paraburkholderia elongata]NPT53693.1 helix-turn-helix domain-containing protein [Paraburkholderia elongata]
MMYSTGVVTDMRLGAGEQRHAQTAAVGCFLYVRQGGVWITVGRRAYCVTQGNGIWLPPAVTHSVSAVYEADICALRIDTGLSADFVPAARVLHCSDVLIAIFSASQRSTIERSYAAVVALVADELRAIPEIAGNFAVRMPSSGSRVAALCEALLMHPTKDMAIEDAASRAGVSCRTLSRIFTKELGASVGRWRREVQVGAAMCALVHGISVAETARVLGFTSSAFSTFFKSRIGNAPREWLARQRIRRPERSASG